MSVLELAAEIKEKGRRSTDLLPPLLHKARQLAQDQSKDPLTRALAHRAAGNALQLLGEFGEALDHYDEALRGLELLDEPRELGRTLHAKVGFLFYLSRFDELFKCAERARALFEKIGDRQHLGRLDANLAHAYFRLDRHVESLQCSERALSVLEDVGDAEGILGATINAAVTLSSMHEFERAEKYFQHALKLSTDLNIPAWVRLSRYNLAYLRYLGGNPEDALRDFSELRKEYRAAHEERQLCVCWVDEAEILLEIGDLDECIRVAREGRLIAERLGLNYEIGKALLFEAAAGLRLGSNVEAMECLRRATLRFQAEGNGVLLAVSRLQAALFRGERGEAAALSDATSARSPLLNSGLPHRLALADIVIGRIQRAHGDLNCAIDSFRSALTIAETSRSKWMQFHAAYELGLSLAIEGDPDSTRLFRHAEGMLDLLWDRLGSDDLKLAFLGDRENVYTHLVRSAISESPEAAFDLSEKARSRVLRERLIPNPSLASVRTIQSKLSSDETILEYFIAGDELYIFTVQSDKLECVRQPGAVSRIKSEWSGLDRHLSSCSVKWERLQSAQHHLEKTALIHLKHIYDEMIAPVRHGLRKTIVFVPHGLLHGIPLHALYDGERFLAEAHKVAYSPSASLYCTPPAEQSFAQPLLVAFSNDGRTTSINEIEEAAEQVQNADVLINPSLQDLGRAFDSPRSLIHIAGHAGVDIVGGRLSWIETPNGRLTSRDLAEMRIRARTLLITGCKTAKRLIQPGDEWLGLMRAFYLSGASAIVSALWDIRDESARRFSSEFYRHFDGQDASSAVMKACGSLRHWRAHPYFWAGFGVFVRKQL